MISDFVKSVVGVAVVVVVIVAMAIPIISSMGEGAEYLDNDQSRGGFEFSEIPEGTTYTMDSTGWVGNGHTVANIISDNFLYWKEYTNFLIGTDYYTLIPHDNLSFTVFDDRIEVYIPQGASYKKDGSRLSASEDLTMSVPKQFAFVEYDNVEGTHIFIENSNDAVGLTVNYSDTMYITNSLLNTDGTIRAHNYIEFRGDSHNGRFYKNTDGFFEYIIDDQTELPYTMETHEGYHSITIDSYDGNIDGNLYYNKVLYPKVYKVVSDDPTFTLIRQIPIIMIAGLIIGVVGTFLYRRLS